MIKETILIGTLALFGLSGCASFMPEVTKYSTEPVERPLLVLPGKFLSGYTSSKLFAPTANVTVSL